MSISDRVLRAFSPARWATASLRRSTSTRASSADSDRVYSSKSGCMITVSVTPVFVTCFTETRVKTPQKSMHNRVAIIIITSDFFFFFFFFFFAPPPHPLNSRSHKNLPCPSVSAEDGGDTFHWLPRVTRELLTSHYLRWAPAASLAFRGSITKTVNLAPYKR